MYRTVKCKRCRKAIFDATACETVLINAHENSLDQNLVDDDKLCSSVTENALIYLREDELPEWIVARLQACGWERGKLNCDACNAHFGNFDFVSGAKCACSLSVLPAVYLIKSKKFKFCGDADCPDWVLAEIYNLSKLSSVKLKLLAQLVAKGIVSPPIDMEKAEKLFSDSKLDASIDLKASVACVSNIVLSTVRYGCDHNALHSELQQLGLPREHSTAIRRVVDDQSEDIALKLKAMSLRVNRLEDVSASADQESDCVNLELKIGGASRSLVMTPYTLDVLLENLKTARGTMAELNGAPYMLH